MVRLNETWGIDADPSNWILVKFGIASRGKSKGQETQTNYGYAGTLDSLLKYMTEVRVKMVASDAKTLKELNKNINKELKTIQSEFKSVVEEQLADKRIKGE